MANNLEFVRSAVEGEVRAAVEGIGMAAVLTDSEFIVGKAGMFGRWGAKLQRYDLSRLSHVRTLMYPAANVLSLNFIGTPPQAFSLMYYDAARTAFAPLIAALEAQAVANEGAAAR